MDGLKLTDISLCIDFLTYSPDINSSLNFFGVASQPLTLGLADFNQFPNAFRVSVLERTNFNDLHLLLLDLDELIAFEFSNQFLFSNLSVDGFRN